MRIQIIIISLLVFGTTAMAQTTGTDNTLNSTGITGIQSTTATGFKLSVGGAVKLFNYGNNGVNSPSLYLSNLSSSTGGKNYYINSDENGFFRIVDSNANAVRFLINDAGNIGIGTTSPTTKLHIAGGFRLVDGSQGAGKVLTSDANGLAGWATPSGGGSSQWTTSGNDIYNNNSGNVGIGTTSPTSGFKLNTVGNVLIQGTTVVNGKLITKESSNGGFLGDDPQNQDLYGLFERTTNTVISGYNYELSKYHYANNNIIVSYTGNVGIGTSSPTAKLDVIGGSTSGSVGIRIVQPYNTTPNAIKIESGQNGDYAILIRPGASGNPYTPLLAFQDTYLNLVSKIGNEYGGELFLQGGNNFVRFGDPYGGITNVRIRSYIYSTGSAPDNYTMLIRIPDAPGVGLRIKGYTSASGNLTEWTDASNNILSVVDASGKLGVGTSTPQAKLDVNGTVRLNSSFFVNSDGTVAIGMVTTYPSGYKFAVAGNIIAEKVRVKLQSTGWPDYVFHPGYILPTLAETEEFIRKNNHLAGVPSAAEIEKDGLDLGDGQAILLKKIEELTLQMIEMNKKLERLEAVNEMMKKPINRRR